MPNSINSSDLTAEQFVSVLKRSGLVHDGALTEALNDFRQQDGSQNVERVAEFLVSRNLITSWHAAKLLKGKHRGFFLGKYKLLTLLGRGGMSSVYLAEHIMMKRHCALKVLPHKFVNDSSYLERFHREAQAVAALDHPNIVRAYDIDSERDGQLEIHFLVMEFIEGHNFYELVKGLGPLEVHTAVDYIRQAALGLQHAHDAGLVHRDIKPGNFIVDKQGTVKMMDLGLAKTFTNHDEFSLTMVNDEKILGTADYLAPEQAVDSHRVDTRADIYALGCTFYFLLTGHPPYGEGTLTQRLLAHQTKTPKPIKSYRTDVPDAIESLISRMMEKKPNERLQTAQEAATKLERWLEKNDVDSSEDSVAQLPLPNLQTMLNQSPSEVSHDSNELIDFLTQLDSKVTHDDPTVRDPIRPTDKPSGAGSEANLHVSTDSDRYPSLPDSSVLSSRSRSSKRSRSTKQLQLTINLWVLGAVVVVALAGFLLLQGDDPPGPEKIVGSSPENSSGKNGANDGESAGVKITGPMITVGPKGDFQKLSEAIRYIHSSAVASDFNEIRIVAGQTIDDAVTIDNSGLGKFPKGFRISGEGPDYPILTGAHDALVTLKSVEGLILSDLEFDASQCQQVLQIEGYASGTRLNHLRFRNIGQRGLAGYAIKGLQQQPLHIDNCEFFALSGAESGAAFDKARSDQFGISGTRQIQIRQCRFLGPFHAGIRFSDVTTDVAVEQSIFHENQRGVVFDGGKEQDISRSTFANNTFHNCKAGINFETGPIEACTAVTFYQNLFVNVPDGEVITQRAGVLLDALSANAITPRMNWTTGSKRGGEKWLDIFVMGGRLDIGNVEFLSLDPSSDSFLKPANQELRTPQEIAVPGVHADFVGAVSP